MNRNILLFAAALFMAVIGAGWLFILNAPSSTDHTAHEYPSVGDAKELIWESPDISPIVSDAFDPERTRIVAREQLLTQIDRETDIFGWVIDEKGAPVARATVSTIQFPWKRLSVLNVTDRDQEREITTTKTDEHGIFRMRVLRGSTVDLRVRAQGFATQQVPNCQAGEKVIITLEPASQLIIDTITQDGTRIDGVNIRFYRRIERPVPGVIDVRRGRTNSEGQLKILDLASGRGLVEASHPDYEGVTQNVVISGATRVVVTLKSGSTISGRVTDRLSGQPIEGARVSDQWTLNHATTTNSEGRFVLRGCSQLVWDIHTTAEGYGRSVTRSTSEGTAEIALDRADTVVGRIIGDDGSPVPHALLTAIASTLRSPMGRDFDTVSSTSRDDGTFEIENVRHDVSHTLVVQATGHARHLLDFAPLLGEPGRLDLGDIRLPSARTIEGRVLRSPESPVVHASVTIKGENQDRMRLTGATVSALHPFDYGMVESRRTDDLGRFRFPDLAPGTYEVSLQCPDAVPVQRTVIISESASRVFVEFLIESSSPFTVWVCDPSGSPVSGIPVTIAPEASTKEVTKNSNADGRVVFEVLEGWIPCSVEVILDNHAYMPIDVVHLTDDTDSIRIILTPSGQIAGHVLGPDDQPVHRIAVSLSDLPKSAIPTFTSSDGAFELKAPMGVPVDIVAFSDSPFRLQGRGALTVNQEGTVRGVLAPKNDVIIRTMIDERSRTLRVLVIDPTGRPVSGAHVNTTLRSGFVVTDETGIAVVEQLPSSPTTFYAWLPRHPDWATSETEIVTPNGQTITLALCVATELTGSVLDVNGQPAKGVHLDISAAGQPSGSGRTDDEGRFRTRIAAGYTYEVRAHLSGPATGQYQEGRKGGVMGGEILIQLRNR